MNIDYFSNLPVDLFFQQITYLPYDSVIAICSANEKIRNYCLDYNNKWKALILNTFKNIPNFREKLKRIQERLFNSEDKYDYQVYTQLQASLLDIITRGMIYYKQGDMKSFNELHEEVQFLSLVLLNKKDILDSERYQEYLNNFGNRLTAEHIYLIYLAKQFAKYGNLKGIKLMELKGVNDLNLALREAATNGHLQVVNYLIEEKKVNIHYLDDVALRWASKSGHLDVIKYLVSKEANIHAKNDEALRFAKQEGHLGVVKYLESLS